MFMKCVSNEHHEQQLSVGEYYYTVNNTGTTVDLTDDNSKISTLPIGLFQSGNAETTVWVHKIPGENKYNYANSVDRTTRLEIGWEEACELCVEAEIMGLKYFAPQDLIPKINALLKMTESLEDVPDEELLDV